MGLSESPLAALAFVLLFPVITSRVLPVLVSPSRLAALLRPRAALLRRPIASSPAETIVLLILCLIVAWNTYRLNPRSAAHRCAKDVFRHASLNIGASTTQLRSRLASFTPEQLGLAGITLEDGTSDSEGSIESDVIERLLRRLSSMGGRQLYLLLGPVPLVECTYCTHASDMQLYLLPSLLLIYTSHAVLIGIMTVSSSVMNTMDAMLSPLWPTKVVPSDETGAAHPRAQTSSKGRANSAGWRWPLFAIICVMMAAEASLLLELVGWKWSSDPDSLWNHPYHNLFLLRHAVLPVLACLAYFYPSSPSQATDDVSEAQREIVQATSQLGMLLSEVGDSVGRTSSNVSLLHLGRQAVWTDTGLREAMTKWYSNRANEPDYRLQSSSGPTPSGTDVVAPDIRDEWLLAEAERRGLIHAESRARTRSIVKARFLEAKEASGLRAAEYGPVETTPPVNSGTRSSEGIASGVEQTGPSPITATTDDTRGPQNEAAS